MTREEAINSFKKSNEQTKLIIQAHRHIMDISEIREREWYIERNDMAIKALEQEPILDKIRAEIEQYQADCDLSCSDDANCRICDRITFDSIYRIIDKYKAGIESGSEKPNKWIPVSERLPEDDDLYFVTFDNGETDLVAFDRGAFSYSGVIAWLPLPEPYRESEGEE